MDGATVSDATTRREETSCRLVRPDGSAWRVRELTFTRHGLKIHARRDAASGSSEEELHGAYLDAGDRLEWRDAEGKVVWSYQNPVDGRTGRRKGGRPASSG